MMMNSIYVRVNANKNSLDFGDVLGVHNSLSRAQELTDKETRKGRDCDMFEIPADSAWKKGESRKAAVLDLMAKREHRRRVQWMVDVLRSERGEEVRMINYTLENIADEKVSLAVFRDRHGKEATTLLDELDRADQSRANTMASVASVKQEVATAEAEYVYSFPAVCGVQAGKSYYTAQVPYSALVKLFSFDDEYVPPQLRAQRVLNENRAKKIGRYIVENPDTYVLPAITACVNQAMTFDPVPVAGASDRLGILKIPVDAVLLINDGQHRRRGIEHAIKNNPKLANETICVTMFFDQGLKYSQQMFSDINNNAVKPSGAISAVYDHRDLFSQWVLQLLEKVPDLKARIDMENGSVSGKNMKLWSIVPFRKFVGLLFNLNAKNFAGQTAEAPERLVHLETMFVELMEQVGEHVPSWKAMVEFGMPAHEARDNLVIAHSVFLEALGAACNALILHQRADELDLSAMEGLRRMSISRTAPVWQNRCVVLGKMQKTPDGVNSTAAILMQKMGLTLPPELHRVNDAVERLNAPVEEPKSAADMIKKMRQDLPLDQQLESLTA